MTKAPSHSSSRLKLKALAGVGGAAALMALAAAPAFAADTGNETVTSPSSPYTPVVDSNANPLPADLTITGSGYDPSVPVFLIICDGKPESSPTWSPGLDCDNLTASGEAFANNSGVVTFPGTNKNYQVGMFRGQSPSDQFNCLAANDNPNGSAVTVSNATGTVAPIDPTVPSWGASKVGAAGGGTAPCTIRVAYSNVNKDTASDKEIALTLPQNGTSSGSPAPSTPESPLAIALPVGAVALFGGAGVVLFRKRRQAAA